MSANSQIKFEVNKKLASCLDVTCLICRNIVVECQYSACVEHHVTCWKCEPNYEGIPTLRSSCCRACQKKLIDPSSLISRHPPKLEKTFLLQKLATEPQAVCEVGKHTAGKLVQATVYCSDCDTYICSLCIPDHITTVDHVPQHTLVTLKRKTYESNKAWCLDCKENQAVSFCQHFACTKSVCGECLRRHCDHDVITLKSAKDTMRDYVTKHSTSVNEKHDDVVSERDSLTDERKNRHMEITSAADRVKQWAQKLREKINNDEKELLNIIETYTNAMDDEYAAVFNILNEEEINLSYFKHVHEILKNCPSEAKYEDAFTFVRLNEEALMDESKSYKKNCTDPGFRCEKIAFKLDQRAMNAVQMKANLLGDINQLPTPTLTNSGGVRSADNGQRLTALTLTLNGKLVMLDSGTSKIKMVNVDNLDRALKTVDISKGSLHQLSSEIVYDERKSTFIIYDHSKRSVLEFREDGTIYRTLDNVKNCTSICLSRDFLFVGRDAEKTDSFRGAMDRYDRITWIQHSTNKLPIIPNSIALTPHHILVSDTINGCVYALDTIEFSPIFKIDRQSARISTPSGIACTNRGHILICDTMDNRIIEFSSTGKFLRVLLSDKDGLRRPYRITCDANDVLYVIDSANQVKVFSFANGIALVGKKDNARPHK